MELLRFVPLVLLGILAAISLWRSGYNRGRDDFMAEWRRLRGE